MGRWVQSFKEGDASQRALLGGKGANLAEMTRLGLPIPPGLTATTDACRAYLGGDGTAPEGFSDEVATGLSAIERATGRRFGDPANPLLVSVRSGAAASMPGMTETVLNLGLDDETVAGLAAQAGDDRFAWDSYRRLIQMYGRVVLGVPGHRFEAVLTQHKRRHGVETDAGLDPTVLRAVADDYQHLVAQATHHPFPVDPWVQLRGAVEAVFRSWNTERAIAYRREFRIPDDLGTAVTVQAMVFAEEGMTVPYLVGTMIELPRAALLADRIAEHADFISFGTNDLTQTTLGMSRDDAGRFLPDYVRRGILPRDPFVSLDVAGVGRLVELGTALGRAKRPDLKVGICGEHGGDPDSIAFFARAGLDYVSCSPYRVPIARLAAAHASLGMRGDDARAA